VNIDSGHLLDGSCDRGGGSIRAASAAASNFRMAWNKKVPEPHAGSMTRSPSGSRIAVAQMRSASQSGV